MAPDQVVVVNSPRAAEDLLIQWIEERQPSGALVAPRCRIVVPSRSVRDGLGAALVRRRQAWLGLSLRTLQGLAFEVLSRAGMYLKPRDLLFPVLVSRLSQEPLCAPHLGAFRDLDSVDPLVATASDLLDAGFTPAHLGALEEVLATLPEAAARRGRFLAVARLAAAAGQEMANLASGRRSDVLVQATEALHLRGSELLQGNSVFIYGFADVTGVAGDFLEALTKVGDARILIVEPHDPACPDRTVGRAFLERLLGRLPSARVYPPSPPGSCAPDLWLAEDPEDEVRWVAEQILAILRSGGVPEHQAVVARDVGPYLPLLRKHFRALGIPFSSYASLGAVSPVAQQAAALLTVLREGDDSPLETLTRAGKSYLFQMAGELGLPGTTSLALLRGCGARTLEEVGRTSPKGAFARISRALGGAEEALEDLWNHLSEWVGAWRKRLAQLPMEGTAQVFRQPLLDSATHCAVPPDAMELLERVHGLVAAEAGGVALRRVEWCWLARKILDHEGSVPLGGQGGGVAVLSGMEARFRTFDHLYVMGLVRDTFPRVAREDPLLPDAARRPLVALLPDIPLAARSADEERYLFGLLLAAGAHVHLSFSKIDEEGRDLVRSPFLDDLAGLEPKPIPRRGDLLGPDTERVATTQAWAVALAVKGHTSEADVLLTAQIREAISLVPALSSVDPERVASIRRRVLDVWDGSASSDQHESPYLGFLGNVRGLENEHGARWVTSLERYAICPWAMFLERLVQLEPGFDPLRRTPELSQDLIGAAVHQVLQSLVRPHLTGDSSGLNARPVAVVSWPDESDLRDRVRSIAKGVLEHEGIALPGMVDGLAAACEPCLEQAKELCFPGGSGHFVAVEEEMQLWLGRFDLRCRADAVTRDDNGVVCIDYKTGKMDRLPKDQGAILQCIRQGELLQGSMYSVASRGKGRYLLLHPKTSGSRVLDLVFDEKLDDSARSSMEFVLTCMSDGFFFPRLWDPKANKEPDACRRCRVRDACSRGESQAREQMKRWGQVANGFRERLWCLKEGNGVEEQPF